MHKFLRKLHGDAGQQRRARGCRRPARFRGDDDHGPRSGLQPWWHSPFRCRGSSAASASRPGPPGGTLRFDAGDRPINPTVREDAGTVSVDLIVVGPFTQCDAIVRYVVEPVPGAPTDTSATGGADDDDTRNYTTPSGTVTIGDGQGSARSLVPITIDINDDTIAEDTVTFRIRLLDTSAITLHGDRPTATVMISGHDAFRPSAFSLEFHWLLGSVDVGISFDGVEDVDFGGLEPGFRSSSDRWTGGVLTTPAGVDGDADLSAGFSWRGDF